MGVPKFFRYISERYPCLSELALEHSIPQFDNLYLDMNGIVHNCSHPDDANIHFHLEETQIFQDIFNYIDKLFYLIKPQKLFFLAVDGVAPRAKMNQQRSRRFRSAREAEQLEAKALQRGEKREHERFDSNCITPGTEFMERLQRGLRGFLRTKISMDPLWQKCRIILSGHETPGEGEHKIMDYIRYMKAQPHFDPNTRHCIYGLDADLIILGLCTHELHFVVLREEVKFGGNAKRTAVEETRFFLLHLGLMREYLELEFHQISTPTKKVDVAQLIDDWVLMGFLVGNDFVPHLPCLHISSNALPLLYKTYISIYPQLGGNINDQGKLNLARLQIFMHALKEVELQQFEEHYDDLKYMNSKTEAFDVDVSELRRNGNNADNIDDLAALIADSSRLYDEAWDEDEDEEAALPRNEFENYKRNYYRNKFKGEMHDGLVEELGHHYITALQWILDYYYRGVQSWDWYYPYHYAPFISDLTNIQNMQVKFSMGKPFLPFEQLLGVLPGASSSLLPEAYHDLMLSESSPLAEFYPTDFETDLNGKKQDWEAVVLIPFIDQQRLLTAMLTREPMLTSKERTRNKHGPVYIYEYTDQSQGSMDALPPLKPLQHVFCKEVARSGDTFVLDLPYTVCVELPNAARHVFFPGFPTMKHLQFDFELRHDRIKVFEQTSRNQTMILMPKKRDLEDTLTAVAGKYLEQVVYIGWPHLIKAKVESVASRGHIVNKNGRNANDKRQFEMDCSSLEEHFRGRMGIKYNNYDILVYIRTFTGSSVAFGQLGSVHMKDTWSRTLTPFPAQGVVGDIEVQSSMHKQFNKIELLFPVGCTVFFIGDNYYGSEGTVLNPMIVYECGRIQVNLRVMPEPDLMAARLLQEQRDRNYINSYKVCRMLDVNSNCLGRLTGTVWVVLGPRREKMENVSKHNIGLQLKYPRLNEERAGYCRRMNNQWFYSNLALELMESYCQRFPAIVKFFAGTNDLGEYVYEQDIYPDKVGQHLIEDVSNWVRQQPHMKVDRITCGSRTACKETVELLLSAADSLRTKPVKNLKLQAKPHLLIKPNVTLPDVYKSPSSVRLFDRVVIVRTIYMVPIGATGTVIGVHPVTDPNPVRLERVNSVETFCDILFDKRVPNCGDIHGIAEGRVYRAPESALVVMHTNDTEEKKQQQEPQLQQQKQHKPRGDVRSDWREQQREKQREQQRGQEQRNFTKQNQFIPKKSQLQPDDYDMPGTSAAAAAALVARQSRQQQQQQQQAKIDAALKDLREHQREQQPPQQQQQQQQPPLQQQEARYMTAAGCKENPITMKVRIPEDFVLPGRGSPAAAAARAGESKPEPPSVVNWRMLSKQMPVKQQPLHDAQATTSPRSSGGSAEPTATPIATPTPTEALKIMLGLQFPKDTQPQTQLQQQPQLQLQQQQRPQLPTFLTNMPSPQQPFQPLQSAMQPPLVLPSQMPKLPQPPLFWREELKQQAKLQSDFIASQQWEQMAQAAKQPVEQLPLMPEPQPQAMRWNHNPQQQQQQLQQQQQQLQQQQLQQQQQQLPYQQQQLQHHHLQQQQQQFQIHYKNSLSWYNNSGKFYPTNNNSYNSSSNNNRAHYEPNAPRRTHTSIQDFVPTQAYRPKKSQLAQQQDKPPSMEKQPATSNETQGASGSSVLNTNEHDEATNELMRTLKIKPTNEEPSTSLDASSNAAAENKTEPAKPRKPYVPRIRAKFDFEYVMP